MKQIVIDTPEVQEFEKEHIREVRNLSPECMVLLKNDGSLPLSKVGKVALYGSGARGTIKGGTGSGDVNVRHFVNVEEGLTNAGFEITTKSWMDQYDEVREAAKKAYFAGIRAQAEAAGENPFFFALGKTLPEPEYEIPLTGEGDTAIYVLARNSGEGTDRKIEKGDVELTATEIRDILALNKMYKTFILVLNVGGMINLEPVDEIGTILLMGQLGSATGDALADVITGKSYPSGKLTMTWASIQDYPSTDGFANPDDTEYKEGIYVGYRYFDTMGVQPKYPFGYGLGYTSFKIETKEIKADSKSISVIVGVTNTGKAPGKEVVQVYYSAPALLLDKPYQELAGYEKTAELLPGQYQELTVTYPTEYMASYDVKSASYVMEKGEYVIRVGNSSRSTQVAGIVALDQDVVIERNKNICGSCDFEDMKLSQCVSAYTGEEKERAIAPKLAICAKDFVTKVNTYQEAPEEIPTGEGCHWSQVVSGEKSINDFISGLTDEDMVYLCIGAYKESDDMMEVVGNASTTVAGAAGETTRKLEKYGLPVLVMADGPAGLRLCETYKLVDGEAIGTKSNFGGDYMYVLTPEEQMAMLQSNEEASAEEEKITEFYQYCVAIPIGTELAQSWNDSLAEKCGEIVGEEMEMFGTHLWLAPAMNIHRSPLCGRNFEYYSEDPVISGRVAAAITNAVQKHDGCATTIKHYACNNQETNRYFSNSKVSERALREIYLKGFEICVKESQPHFLMTSYNLINGEHACNSKDLQTYVLRDEWGFQGTVMTDWLVTGGMGKQGNKWPCASAAGNVKAGNDITMPGIPTDKADMLEALLNAEHPYALTRAELQLSAKRVLEMILKLA